MKFLAISMTAASLFALFVMSPVEAGVNAVNNPGKGGSSSLARSGSTYSQASMSSKTVPRKSLLSNPSSQPSPKVAEIIKKQESTGPGWIGTAFLVSLLSQHDLSSSDKSWIQQQISAREAETAEAVTWLAPVSPKVVFSYDGLQHTYQVGDQVAVRVLAKHMGKDLPVSCSVLGADAVQTGNKVSWTPKVPSVQMLECNAGGRTDKKLFKII